MNSRQFIAVALRLLILYLGIKILPWIFVGLLADIRSTVSFQIATLTYLLVILCAWKFSMHIASALLPPQQSRENRQEALSLCFIILGLFVAMICLLLPWYAQWAMSPFIKNYSRWTEMDPVVRALYSGSYLIITVLLILKPDAVSALLLRSRFRRRQ